MEGLVDERMDTERDGCKSCAETVHFLRKFHVVQRSFAPVTCAAP